MPTPNIRSKSEALYATRIKREAASAAPAVAADALNVDAAAVVADDKLQDAWRTVREALPESPLQKLGPLAFIDVPKTNTQVWLYWRRSEDVDSDEEPVRQVRLGELPNDRCTVAHNTVYCKLPRH